MDIVIDIDIIVLEMNTGSTPQCHSSSFALIHTYDIWNFLYCCLPPLVSRIHVTVARQIPGCGTRGGKKNQRDERSERSFCVFKKWQREKVDRSCPSVSSWRFLVASTLLKASRTRRSSSISGRGRCWFHLFGVSLPFVVHGLLYEELVVLSDPFVLYLSVYFFIEYYWYSTSQLMGRFLVPPRFLLVSQKFWFSNCNF